MPYKLQSKKIKICGETLTVFQASNAMETTRSIMIADADARWAGRKSDELADQARRYLETLVYPSLIACTTGNLPTYEEFNNNVPAEETLKWEAAAREMNPRWFPSLVYEQEDLEKKEQLQTGSSPD